MRVVWLPSRGNRGCSPARVQTHSVPIHVTIFSPALRCCYRDHISPYPGVTPLVVVSLSVSHDVTLALGIFDPDYTKMGDTKQHRWIRAGIYIQHSVGRIHLDMDHAKLRRGKETEYLLHLRRVGVAMVTPCWLSPSDWCLVFVSKGRCCSSPYCWAPVPASCISFSPHFPSHNVREVQNYDTIAGGKCW